MRLFISSFKTFQGKLLLVTLSLLCLYLVMVHKIQPGYGTSMNLQNYIKAETFTYNNQNWANVIVGSSMAERIRTDLHPEFFSLAFPAGGSLTGLKIVTKSEHVPKIVFIEVNNTLLRGMDEKVIDHLFMPILGDLRKNFPIFQKRYQPGLLVNNIIYPKMSSLLYKKEEKVKKDNFKAVLKIQQDKLKVRPDEKVVAGKIDELGQLIDVLHKRGTLVVLFEPPMHPSLENSITSKFIRTKLKNRFPENKYKWLTFNGNFDTTDGIHLTDESALEFTKIIFKQLDIN